MKHPAHLSFSVLLVCFVLPSSASAQYTLSTLVTFNGENGTHPWLETLMADASGSLFGTTHDGGANDDGTVFEIDAGTHTLSTLATFNGTNGSNPYASLLADAGGNLYGTTYKGGANNVGTVFELAAGTHAITTLATFNGANGAGPLGSLIADASGNLYGTTYSGGANNDGTVFKVAAGTHMLSTLATFNGTNGSKPYAALLADASGNLYSTTYAGGASDDGTVFKLAVGTYAISTIATFNGTNGAHTYAGLIADASGNLYGTTLLGGANGDGTVFKLAATTHEISTLATFDGTIGFGPAGSLLADASGNLFGTTENGGANSDGNVFEVAGGTLALSTLATFNGMNGVQPFGGLFADSSGNLYGTTVNGGASGGGIVFELSPVPLSGDFNRDGHVNAADVQAMVAALADLNSYKMAKSLSDSQLLAIGDINGDGVVTNGDVQALLDLLKTGGGSTAAVPEPATLALAGCGLVIAALAVLQQRICATWRRRDSQ